jgi:hypothetical protein
MAEDSRMRLQDSHYHASTPNIFWSDFFPRLVMPWYPNGTHFHVRTLGIRIVLDMQLVRKQFHSIHIRAHVHISKFSNVPKMQILYLFQLSMENPSRGAILALQTNPVL